MSPLTYTNPNSFNDYPIQDFFEKLIIMLNTCIHYRTIYLLLNGTLYPVANPDTVEALGFAGVNDVVYTSSDYVSELAVSSDLIDMYNPRCNVTILKIEALNARSQPVPVFESGLNTNLTKKYDESTRSQWDMNVVDEKCPVYHICDLGVSGLGDRLERYIFCVNVAKFFEATLLIRPHSEEGVHKEFTEYTYIMV